MTGGLMMMMWCRPARRRPTWCFLNNELVLNDLYIYIMYIYYTCIYIYNDCIYI